MHVTLIHKLDAGDGEHSGNRLVALLRENGHAVAYHSTDDAWSEALDNPGDLVLIAGGDGTVGSVVLQLRGSGVPFAVLPLGTANNIAARLGWQGRPEQIIPLLHTAHRRPFDVGVAQGPWGMRCFVEGVGLGAFARTMTFVQANKKETLIRPDRTDDTIVRDLRLARSFVAEIGPHRWRIEMDDEPVEGAFLLVEVMNTGLVGPNIGLAPEADPSDGLFDVVLVEESEREALLGYLDARIQGASAEASLTARRAARIRIRAEGFRAHLDDDVWPPAGQPPPPADASYDIDVRMTAGALTAVVPAEHR